jgi:hypothetical protein
MREKPWDDNNAHRRKNQLILPEEEWRWYKHGAAAAIIAEAVC